MFGTRGRRFENFLKSSASVSEKHEVDSPAETAEKRFSQRTPIRHRSDAITDCFETSCGDLCGDLFGDTASADLTGRGFGELTFLRKSEYWELLVVWETLSSRGGVSPRQ